MAQSKAKAVIGSTSALTEEEREVTLLTIENIEGIEDVSIEPKFALKSLWSTYREYTIKFSGTIPAVREASRFIIKAAGILD